jgi:hypothetical protein
MTLSNLRSSALAVAALAAIRAAGSSRAGAAMRCSGSALGDRQTTGGRLRLVCGPQRRYGIAAAVTVRPPRLGTANLARVVNARKSAITSGCNHLERGQSSQSLVIALRDPDMALLETACCGRYSAACKRPRR